MELNIGTGPLPEKISVSIVLGVLTLVAAGLVACIGRTKGIDSNEAAISFGSLPGPEHLSTGIAFQKRIVVSANAVGEGGSAKGSLFLEKHRNVAVCVLIECDVP